MRTCIGLAEGPLDNGTVQVKPDDVEFVELAIMVARANSSMQMLMRMRLSSVKLLGSASVESCT